VTQMHAAGPPLFLLKTVKVEKHFEDFFRTTPIPWGYMITIPSALVSLLSFHPRTGPGSIRTISSLTSDK
jgi:hypothetical protein